MRFLPFFRLIGIFILLISFTSILANPPVMKVTSVELQEIADKYLKQYREIENISAITLTVDSDKMKATAYSGTTDFFGKKAVNGVNLYQIGSITKSFIAVIILQLEADSELHLNINDKLSVYLPQYVEWGNVTIKQLLNMTSGIPDYLNDDHYLQDIAHNPYKQWQPEEQLNYVAKKTLLFSPGTKWSYSNTNYILAGLIIRKLTGHSVEEEMNKRFFASANTSHLNLKNTFYIMHQYPVGVAKRMVHGYRFGGNIGKFIPLKTDITDFSLSYAGAAGALVSNTDDIAQWIRTLLTTNKILPAKQLKELMTLVSMSTGKPLKIPTGDDPNGFGLGIGLSYAESDFPGLIVNYEGMTMGYRAQYIYVPTLNLLISVTTNSSVDPDNDHLMELIGSVYDALQK